MYVSNLKIKNFRNFGDPPFSMDMRPFTLVLGENNIGKTNLLAAMSLLFSQEISAIQRRSLELDDINDLAVMAFKKQVADQTVEVDKVNFPEVEIHTTLSDIQDDQHPVVAGHGVFQDGRRGKQLEGGRLDGSGDRFHHPFVLQRGGQLVPQLRPHVNLRLHQRKVPGANKLSL